MPRALEADYTKTYLLPRAVEDLVPVDHPVRLIRELVDMLDCPELEDRSAPDKAGRPAYSKRLLLRIWIFAYVNRVTSCRKLETMCKEWLPAIWLTGELAPDHNTLWRFWSHEKSLIEKVFEQSLHLALKFDLIDMVRHAVDGTKLHAAGSARRAVNQEVLRKRIERLDEVIHTIEAEIERTRESEEGQTADTLSGELQSRQALRARIEKELQTAEPELRTHPDEPEARLMKGVGLGYNAQIVTDLKAGIIVAADVVNDTNDVKQLVPMLDQVHERFERVADITLADGGYHSGEAIATAEEKNYTVVVAPGQHEETKKPHHVSQFTYELSSDSWQCPEGQTLTYVRTRQGKGRPAVRLYSNPAACRDCPVRQACTRNPRGREIELNPNRAALERHRQRREENRSVLRFRMLVEHAFARIKHRFGFRRFRFSGLEKANLEWKFMVAVNNLAIIMNKIRPMPA